MSAPHVQKKVEINQHTPTTTAIARNTRTIAAAPPSSAMKVVIGITSIRL